MADIDNWSDRQVEGVDAWEERSWVEDVGGPVYLANTITVPTVIDHESISVAIENLDPEATHVEIEYALVFGSSLGPWIERPIAVGDLPLVLTGLLPDQAYRFRSFAYNSTTQSEFLSAAVDATTDAAPAPDPDPPLPPTIDALNPAVSPRTISGTGVPGAVVQLLIDSVPFQSIVVDVYGDWAVGFNAAPGAYSLEARQLVGALASAYTEPVVFVIVPDVAPRPHSYYGGSLEEEKKPPPPPPPLGVRLLSVPFRRPAAWPGERSH